MTDVIAQHLDVWTSAIFNKSTAGRGTSNKQTAYGIKKLRELILELAVRGKLVPQDPNDEPASALLKKISNKRIALVNEGKLRKQNSSPKITTDEKRFELPNGWEFVRFGDVIFNRDAERIPLSVDERQGRRGKYDYYGASGVIDSIDAYLFDKPLLLIGEDGANLINRSTPIAFMARGKYWVNNHAHVIDGLTEDLLLYLCLHINAISLESYVTGTAQPKMNQAKMNTIVLALPPVEEQHRIVAKVDELMALCDRLEQQQTDSIAAHQTLVQTLLDTLTQTADAAEFELAWSRIADHFDILFTTESSIDQLKQTLLQLAVMGKLVPQDPNDEPASDLLKRIQSEKRKMVKLGQIRAEKEYPPITDYNNQLPIGWVICRWNNIAMKIGDIDHKMPETVSDGIPYVSPRDFYPNNIIDFDNAKRISKDDYLRLAAKIKPDIGDLIYPRYGTIGENRLVMEQRDFLASYSCAVIKTLKGFIDPKYQYIFSISGYCRYQAKSAENKTTQANVGIASIQQFLVPLPPLAEQHRIVAKVDELMALCDALKARIAAAQTTQLQLADAIVEQAIT